MKRILIIALVLSTMIPTALSAQKDSAGYPYIVAEQQAEYPGGSDSLRYFIIKHIDYPAYALENGIQGTVWIEAIVGKDGTLSDFKVLKGDDTLAKEAIHVLKLMPKWSPGMIDGKPVNVKIRIPIIYRLSDGDSKPKERKKKRKSRQ
jgi:TonB family protein